MNRSTKSIIALVAICLVTTALLATVNYLTAPIIEKNEKEAERRALKVVFPDGEDFQEISILSDLPQSVKKVYKETSGKGYVFRLSVSGYSSGMVILCGVSDSGAVTGAVCLSSKETLGYEKTFGENFTGADKTTVGGVDTIAGATRTTKAYRAAVADAIAAFETAVLSSEKEVQ